MDFFWEEGHVYTCLPCCAEAGKTIAGMTEKVLDWQNAAYRNRDEADKMKATVED